MDGDKLFVRDDSPEQARGIDLLSDMIRQGKVTYDPQTGTITGQLGDMEKLQSHGWFI